MKFTELQDTPNSLTDQGGKIVAVNSGATALEFVDEVPSTETAQSIRDKLETLMKDNRFSAFSLKDLTYFISLIKKPTDLTNYVHNAVLRVTTPDPGAWYRVTGSDVLHGFELSLVPDPSNANNRISSVLNPALGQIATEEGSALNIDDSPLGLFEFKATESIVPGVFTYNPEMRFKNASFSGVAPNTLYCRIYNQAAESENAEVTTFSMA